MIFIGIDGGGTKTEFLMTDAEGNELARKKIGSISCRQVGRDTCISTLKETLDEMLREADIDSAEEVYTCCGMPNFGESTDDDEFLMGEMATTLRDCHIHLVNDCEVGWAGSLALQPGINAVAGTGAIIFGRNEEGKSARAGGWCNWFSDEGSCYWLGVRTIELFSKESDGRAPEGALPGIVREHFHLQRDYDINDIYERDYRNDRTKTAALQMLLLDAARQGDAGAVQMYETAAQELALGIKAVRNTLGFVGKCIVSYSGGLFHAGDLVLTPLKKALETYDIVMEQPLLSPATGAVLLAADTWAGKKAALKIAGKMLSKCQKGQPE